MIENDAQYEVTRQRHVELSRALHLAKLEVASLKGVINDLEHELRSWERRKRNGDGGVGDD